MIQPLVILASASPRRRELLHQIGIAHQVVPADIMEEPGPGESPRAYVQRVAAEKSQATLRLTGTPLPVLAADTEVIIDDEILGKPRDADHARAMLKQLSGREHQVISAVSLRQGARHLHAMSISTVRLRCLTVDEVDAYLKTGEPMGKAGGYAIQGHGALFISQLTGSYSGVMGLPLHETAELLAELGLHPLFQPKDQRP